MNTYSKHIMTDVFAQGTISATDVEVEMKNAPIPCTISITPGSGVTITYYYSLDRGITWITRAAVTTYTEDQLIGSITDLKFSRTAGSADSTYVVI